MNGVDVKLQMTRLSGRVVAARIRTLERTFVQVDAVEVFFEISRVIRCVSALGTVVLLLLHVLQSTRLAAASDR